MPGNSAHCAGHNSCLVFLIASQQLERPGTRSPSSLSVARNIRFIVPGRIYEVTLKTFQARYFFVPSKQLNEIVTGVFAYARQRCRAVRRGVCKRFSSARRSVALPRPQVSFSRSMAPVAV